MKDTVWIQKQLDTGKLTVEDVALLARAFQTQNALSVDGKPGAITLGRAREILDCLQPEQPESGTSPNLSMPPAKWPHGIDVSHHQTITGDLDGEQVVYAIVKATEGTSGSGSQDTKMIEHLGKLREKSRVLGLYHFARPSSAVGFGSEFGQPLGEAENFARRWEDATEFLNGSVPLLPPVLDIEDVRKGVPEPAKLVDWCAEWCDHCEGLIGREPMIYTYFSYIWQQLNSTGSKTLPGCVPVLGGYHLWLADYRAVPPRAPRGIPGWDWLIWQWTGEGSVRGIPGHCDRNVMRATVDELTALAL